MTNELTLSDENRLTMFDPNEQVEAEFGVQTAYLNVCQPLSVAVTEHGAKPGDIFNSVTGEVSKELVIIPHFVGDFMQEIEAQDDGMVTGRFRAWPTQSKAIKHFVNANGGTYKNVRSDRDLDFQRAVSIDCSILKKEGDGYVHSETARIKLTSTNIRNYVTFAKRMPLGTKPYQYLVRLSTEKRTDDKKSWHVFMFNGVNGNFKNSMIEDPELLKKSEESAQFMMESFKEFLQSTHDNN